MSCYECSRKGGHAETGGIHQPWHCKRELCPDRAKHYENVYAGRVTTRYGSMTRDGVSIITMIDGKDADKHYRQERCICGLVLIYTPKARQPVAPAHTDGAS